MQKARDLPDFGFLGVSQIVSQINLPGIVRHLALLANNFAQVYVHYRRERSLEYVSFWRQSLSFLQIELK